MTAATFTKKAPGTACRFESAHDSSRHLSGRICTVTDEEPLYPWHYVVRDETGTWLAMDGELVAITEGAS